MKRMLLAALAVAALPAHAQVFKCQEGGKTVFSDRPCHAEAQPLKLKPAGGEYDDDAAEAARERSRNEREMVSNIERQRDTDRRLAAAEHERKRRLEAERCAKLRRDHEEAASRAKAFRYPENIRREQEKAKQAASDSFFQCDPGERVSAFDN